MISILKRGESGVTAVFKDGQQVSRSNLRRMTVVDSVKVAPTHLVNTTAWHQLEYVAQAALRAISLQNGLYAIASVGSHHVLGRGVMVVVPSELLTALVSGGSANIFSRPMS